jgi:hypothetical protein
MSEPPETGDRIETSDRTESSAAAAPARASTHVALRLFMAAVALAAGIAAVVVAIQLVRTVL